MEHQDRLIDLRLLLLLIRKYARIIISSSVLVLLIGAFLTYSALEESTYERVREITIQPAWIDLSSQMSREKVPSDLSAAVSNELTKLWSEGSLKAVSSDIDDRYEDVSALITGDPEAFRFIGKTIGRDVRQVEDAGDELMTQFVRATEQNLEQWLQDVKSTANAAEAKVSQELDALYGELDEQVLEIPLEKSDGMLLEREILIKMIADYQRTILEDPEGLNDEQYAAMNSAEALLRTLDSYLQRIDELKSVEKTNTFLMSHDLVLISEDISSSSADSFDEKELVKTLLRILFGYLVLLLFLLTVFESRKQLTAEKRG